MGDGIGSGLLSMAVYFDFHSTNVVQLSNLKPILLQVSMSSPINNPAYSLLKVQYSPAQSGYVLRIWI